MKDLYLWSQSNRALAKYVLVLVYLQAKDYILSPKLHLPKYYLLLASHGFPLKLLALWIFRLQFNSFLQVCVARIPCDLLSEAFPLFLMNFHLQWWPLCLMIVASQSFNCFLKFSAIVVFMQTIQLYIVLAKTLHLSRSAFQFGELMNFNLDWSHLRSMDSNLRAFRIFYQRPWKSYGGQTLSAHCFSYRPIPIQKRHPLSVHFWYLVISAFIPS